MVTSHEWSLMVAGAVALYAGSFGITATFFPSIIQNRRRAFYERHPTYAKLSPFSSALVKTGGYAVILRMVGVVHLLLCALMTFGFIQGIVNPSTMP